MKHERGIAFGSPDASCTGKRPYLTYDAAARVVSRQKGKTSGKPTRLQIYRCTYCRHWHMGGGPS